MLIQQSLYLEVMPEHKISDTPPISLPTGLGGSHTRGRNIETRELDHAEACPRIAAATDLTSPLK